jgi:hypothetical protein
MHSYVREICIWVAAFSILSGMAALVQAKKWVKLPNSMVSPVSVISSKNQLPGNFLEFLLAYPEEVYLIFLHDYLIILNIGMILTKRGRKRNLSHFYCLRVL